MNSYESKYKELKSTISKLPMIMEEDNGVRVTITDGYENVAIYGEFNHLHFYKIYTMKPSGYTEERIYENGMYTIQVVN